MLSSDSLLTLQRCQTALTAHGEAELAKALGAVLAAQLAHRASVGAAAVDRAKAKADKGGAGKGLAFAIELQPGWRRVVNGSGNAHRALEEALAEVGALAMLPKATSLSVTLSRSGSWWRVVDTDNGTVTVSVRKLETGTVRA